MAKEHAGSWCLEFSWSTSGVHGAECAEQRLLHEAPGHLFLGHESEDLASFMQVAMLNGWGGYLLTQANYVNAFFSHDGFIDFFTESDHNLTAIREAWGTTPP